MKRRSQLTQRGDTIVEVLIAVVIVSAVLVGAFTISNLSLKQIRMSQERGEGQKIAQQYTENIDTLTQNPAYNILTEVGANGTPFCVDPSTGVKSVSCSVAPRYKIQVQRIGSSGSKTFKIVVWWDGLKGLREEVVYYYRIPGA